MKLNEEVGDLHQMNPTSFFCVVGYMMFIFSYYSLLAADSNPLFLKRLGYFFYAGLQIRWSAKGSVFDRNSQKTISLS